MASSAVVSVHSVAGEMILPVTQIHDHEDIQVLTDQVRVAAAARHVRLASKTGETLVESLSAREHGIVDGDQLTAVFEKHDVLWLLPVASKYIVRFDITAGTVCGIKCDGKRGQGTPFGGAVCVGNKTYFMPVDSDAMLIYSITTEKITTVDVSAYAEGKGKFSAAIVANGRIHFVPGRSDNLLVYDVATGEFSGVDITHVTRSRYKWHNAVLDGDNIIALPCSATAILVYNVVTCEATGIPICPAYCSLNVAGEHVVQDRGRIYVLPNVQNKMLIYDCDSQAVSEVEADDVAVSRTWAGGTVVDGTLFALPRNGQYIWRYDTVLQTSSRIDASNFGGGWAKIVSVDGLIYCAPCTSRFILEYNAKTGELSGIDTGFFAQGHGKMFADVVLAEDNLYFVPHNTNAILGYDRARKCTFQVDVSALAARTGKQNWHFGVHLVEH